MTWQYDYYKRELVSVEEDVRYYQGQLSDPTLSEQLNRIYSMRILQARQRKASLEEAMAAMNRPSSTSVPVAAPAPAPTPTPDVSAATQDVATTGAQVSAADTLIGTQKQDLIVAQDALYFDRHAIERTQGKAYLDAVASLETYNRNIQNGQFVGSEQEFSSYQNAYRTYEAAKRDYDAAYSVYGSQVEKFNTGLGQYNQNLATYGSWADRYNVALGNLANLQSQIIGQFNADPNFATINALQNQYGLTPELRAQLEPIAQANQNAYETWKAGVVAQEEQYGLDTAAINAFNLNPTGFDFSTLTGVSPATQQGIFSAAAERTLYNMPLDIRSSNADILGNLGIISPEQTRQIQIDTNALLGFRNNPTMQGFFDLDDRGLLNGVSPGVEKEILRVGRENTFAAYGAKQAAAAVASINLTPTSQADVARATQLFFKGYVDKPFIEDYIKIANQNILNLDFVQGKPINIIGDTELKAGDWGYRFSNVMNGLIGRTDVFYDVNKNSVLEDTERIYSGSNWQNMGALWTTYGNNPDLWATSGLKPAGAGGINMIRLVGAGNMLTGAAAQQKLAAIAEWRATRQTNQELAQTGYIGSDTALWSTPEARRAAFEGVPDTYFPLMYSSDSSGMTKADVRASLFPVNPIFPTTTQRLGEVGTVRDGEVIQLPGLNIRGIGGGGFEKTEFFNIPSILGDNPSILGDYSNLIPNQLRLPTVPLSDLTENNINAAIKFEDRPRDTFLGNLFHGSVLGKTIEAIQSPNLALQYGIGLLGRARSKVQPFFESRGFEFNPNTIDDNAEGIRRARGEFLLGVQQNTANYGLPGAAALGIAGSWPIMAYGAGAAFKAGTALLRTGLSKASTVAGGSNLVAKGLQTLEKGVEPGFVIGTLGLVGYDLASSKSSNEGFAKLLLFGGMLPFAAGGYKDVGIGISKIATIGRVKVPTPEASEVLAGKSQWPATRPGENVYDFMARWKNNAYRLPGETEASLRAWHAAPEGLPKETTVHTATDFKNPSDIQGLYTAPELATWALRTGSGSSELGLIEGIKSVFRSEALKPVAHRISNIADIKRMPADIRDSVSAAREFMGAGAKPGNVYLTPKLEGNIKTGMAEAEGILPPGTNILQTGAKFKFTEMGGRDIAINEFIVVPSGTKGTVPMSSLGRGYTPAPSSLTAAGRVLGTTARISSFNPLSGLSPSKAQTTEEILQTAFDVSNGYIARNRGSFEVTERSAAVRDIGVVGDIFDYAASEQAGTPTRTTTTTLRTVLDRYGATRAARDLSQILQQQGIRATARDAAVYYDPSEFGVDSRKLIDIDYFNKAKDESRTRFTKKFGVELRGEDILSSVRDSFERARYIGDVGFYPAVRSRPEERPSVNYGSDYYNTSRGRPDRPGNTIDRLIRDAERITGVDRIIRQPDRTTRIPERTYRQTYYNPPPYLLDQRPYRGHQVKISKENERYFRTFRASPIIEPFEGLEDLKKQFEDITKGKARKKRRR